MVKIQKISEIDHTFGFIEFNVIKKYCHSFPCSKLGRFYSLYPACELVLKIQLKNSSLVRKSYFLAEG
ncbi:transposase [Bacteroides nordii]|uniref:Transposase n=1 Tax=Bacteroides nordii TaxID=291645 RepID=A0A413VPQ7_9BACE|nr:transposase [Bacteroides nordii]